MLELEDELLELEELLELDDVGMYILDELLEDELEELDELLEVGA